MNRVAAVGDRIVVVVYMAVVARMAAAEDRVVVHTVVEVLAEVGIVAESSHRLLGAAVGNPLDLNKTAEVAVGRGMRQGAGSANWTLLNNTIIESLYTD